MKRRHRFIPSSGFIMLVMSYALLVSFFAWGYTQPDLVRAWYVLQSMQREEFNGLKASDARILESVLQQQPRFAHALIGRSAVGFVEPADEGWVSLARSHLVIQMASLAAAKLVIECRAGRGAYPLSITLEAQNVRAALEFTEDGERTLDWSNELLRTPAWVVMTVTARHHDARIDVPPAVRVRLIAAGTKESKP